MYIMHPLGTISLLFFVTSCANNVSKRIVVANGGGEGGNPEVKTINQCFQLQDRAKIQCLNLFYPEDINIKFSKHFTLAGRGNAIEKGTFNLKGQRRLLLDIDTSNIKLPIQCNVRNSKLSQSYNSLIVDILVEDIEKSIILYDKKHKTILEYQVIK